jgi:nucleotide-binding universal stress UspA family protein
MKTIIVPLDFSEESKNGLDMALMLANKTGANIQMVHVIERNADEDASLMKEEYQIYKLKFEDIIKTCREKNNLKCGLDYVITKGKLFRDITEMAEKREDAVIVLSTHGSSGFEELFIGGNAYKITSHSRNPVITVRKRNISANINTIVLPLDITFETREKVPYTVKLAKLFKSKIHIITVRSSNLKSIQNKLQKYAQQVASFVDYHDIQFKIEHLHGRNLTDVILEYSKLVDADLISIMTEQEKSVSNILLGNYAHQMINKSNIPVLVMPTFPLSHITDDIWSLGSFGA